MRAHIIRLITAAFVAAVTSTPALALDVPDIPASLKAVKLPNDALSLVVRPLTSSEVAPLSYRADVPVNPASTMKLLTTFAALDMLGPTFQWQTQVYGLGKQVEDRWQGDIYVKGQGDPKLTQEQLWLMMRQLRQKGIRQIDGRLVLDRTYYTPIAETGETLDGEDERPYNVPPDPLAVNFKTLRLQILNRGDRLELSAEPSLPGLTLVNQLTAREDGNCQDWRSKVQVSVDAKKDGGLVATVKGRFPLSCPQASYLTAVGTHPTFAMASIRDTWREMGGSWPLLDQGSANVWSPQGATPADAVLLASQSSPTLVDVIKDVNKFSNNLMARSVFIAIGRQQGTGQAPIAETTSAIRRWLSGHQTAFPELVLENGAGLSRVERISATHLADVLTMAWQSPWMPEYMGSLPIAGVDGTLKRRFANSMQASAHLKTGTLNDVRALAGYIHTKSGQWCAFVGVLNHKSAERGVGVLDQLATYVYENY